MSILCDLYVDDIQMASKNLEMITDNKGCLTLNFDMKDMGDASYVLRVKIHKVDLIGFLISRKRRT